MSQSEFGKGGFSFPEVWILFQVDTTFAQKWILLVSSFRATASASAASAAHTNTIVTTTTTTTTVVVILVLQKEREPEPCPRSCCCHRGLLQ